jgi:hypothetical protein
MTEVDMLVRDTLADRAEAAPNGAGLLIRVQTRSRLIRRRRRVAAAGAGVAAVLLGVGAVPAVNGLLPGSSGDAREGFGGPAATGPATPRSVDPSGPETPPPPMNAVLAAPSFTVPTVPFRPAMGVIPGLPAAVASYDEHPMIMHTSGAETDPLLMLYVGSKADDIPGEKISVRVHGVTGTLVRPTDQVHPGLQLSWTEPDGTAMWISAGNVTPEQVVAYANGLRRENMPISAPFTFNVLPQGLELQTVTASEMIFGRPNQVGASWQYKLGFILGADGGDDAATWPLQVGGHRAKMNPQDDGGRMLMVSLPNGNVLSVQVPVNLTISDADLFRMAAGVTVNSGAKAGRG